MKPEQDTATKANIGSETNDFGDRWSTRKMVRDKWWETSQSTEKTSGEPGTTRRVWETNKGRQVQRRIQRAGHQ